MKKLSRKSPLIYLISEGLITPQNFPEKSAELLAIIKSAVKNNISLIQIREKNLTAGLVFELTRKAASLVKNSESKILVNDRADIALAANAHGVHLTSNSIPAQIIRQHFPSNFVIGVSAHSLEDIKNAKKEGADFAAFSPVFQSPGKGKSKGLDELREVCGKAKDFPVVALGGIDETNYKSVLDIGAAGFAAIRFLNNAENLRKLSEQL